jgi:hypothetical protein
MKRIGLTIIIICLLSSLNYAADIQLIATVDRISIALNQTFTYSIEISGDKIGSLRSDPQLPTMEEFASYMGSSGTSQNIQFVNGRMSVTKSMNYTFMATKVGKFTIEPAVIEYKGNTYKSDPIQIEIVKQAQQPRAHSQKQKNRSNQSSQQGSLQDDLFLKVFVNKKRVYVNEPVILTYKIYTAVNISSYGISKAPNTTGFWTEEFPMGKQPKTYREIYQGREFLIAEIRKIALFPTEIGKKTISPMQITCDVRMQTSRRSVFDSFFDDPFFGRSVQHTIYSPSTTIEVLPLPQKGKPEKFSGAVGNYSIKATIDKNNVVTNDAVALKVKIAGTGNIKVLPTPKVDIPTDFEQYEPKVSMDIKRTGNQISGSKTFEYVLIPRFPGTQKIKPIKFSYFDTNSKSYKEISTPEINIFVKKGKEDITYVSTGLSKEQVKLIRKDIRYIQTHTPEFRKIGKYFYNSYLFMALLIFPLILTAVSIAYRQRLDKLSENVAYARSQKANQIAMKQLKKAAKVLSDNTQKQFYAEISSALRGFLADKLNISAAGIITDQVESMMKSRNINDTIITKYLNCLQVCDYQRFAPSNSTIEDMKQFYNQAKDAIISLERAM